MHGSRFLLFLALVAVLGLPGCERFRNHTDVEHVQRAKDFQARGDLRAAEIELKNAITKNPGNGEARLMLGEIHLALHRGAEAEKEFKRALELGAEPESLKVPLARAYLLQKDHRRLLREIEVGPRTSERNASRILKLRGDALLGLRNPGQACQLYQEARDRDARNVEAYLGLATCAVAEADFDRARQHLEAARKLDAKNDEAWLYLAELEHALNRLAEAEKAYAEAARLNPYNVDAWAGHAVLMVRKGATDRAREDIRKLRATGIDHPAALYVEALLALGRGEPRKALELVQKLEKAHPAYAPGWLLAAWVYLAQGVPSLAEQYTERYLALQPGDPVATRIKAAILLSTRRAAQVPPLLLPLVERAPHDQTLLALLGQAYLDSGDYARAAQWLEKAWAADPSNVAVQVSLGRSYLEAGVVTRGEEVLEAAARAQKEGTEADLLLFLHHLRNRHWDKALARIAAIEAKHPEAPLGGRLRALVEEQRGNPAAARLHLEQAASKDPGDLATAAALARLDLRENRPDAARSRYLKVLKQDRRNGEAMLMLAELARARGAEAEYEEWLRKAAETDRTALRPRALLALHYLAAHQPQRALAVAREAHDANPGSPEALELLGRVQLAAGERENALATFSRLVTARPGVPAGYLALSEVQMSLGRAKEARLTLEKGLAQLPGHPPLVEALARLNLQEGRLEEALDLARKLVARDAAGGHLLEGDVLLRQNRFKDALRAYEQALEIRREGAVMARIHQALVLDGKAAEADRRMLRWLEERPADVASRIYLAESHLLRKMTRAAQEQYEAALKVAPNHPRALNNLALIYLEQGDPRALELAERAYRAQPDDVRLADTLGWVLVEQGQAARGAEILRRAVEKAPGWPGLRYHLAVALARSGDRAGARRELDTLLGSGKAFPERAAAEALRKTL